MSTNQETTMSNNPYVYDTTKPHTPVTPRPITQETTMHKSRAEQAIELFVAYPDTPPAEVANLLGVTEKMARTWWFRATGKLPTRGGENNKYNKVREYIIAHPKASIRRIANACNCTESYVSTLLNPRTGAIAAEFGDIRKNHFKHKSPAPMSLSVPRTKVSIIKKDAEDAEDAEDAGDAEARRAMVKLLGKKEFTRADLKQLAMMLVMLDGMVTE
jgi:hypothetical protein